MALANAATSLLHGAEAAAEAADAAAAVFGEGASADALPTVEVSQADLGVGMLIAAAFSAAGLAASNGEARRLIKQGAAKVNDVTVNDQNGVLGPEDLIDGAIKLSAGKKRHALLKVAG